MGITLQYVELSRDYPAICGAFKGITLQYRDFFNWITLQHGELSRGGELLRRLPCNM